MRRRVEIDDIKEGAKVYNDRGDLFIISEVNGDRVYFTEWSMYSTVGDILYRFMTEDEPTGIPTFDGSVREEHISINQYSSKNAKSKDSQIGGDHYNKNDPIQFARDNYPAEQLEGFFRINVDKYVARYDKKNGLEDLKKARHYLDMLIELKENQDAE